MQTKTISTESFNALEREMQNRFAELASIFDFADAERKAVDSLNNVYNLADKARDILSDDFTYTPSKAILDAQELADQKAAYSDLFARYMALEAEVLIFLTTNNFHDGDHAVTHSAKSVAIPGAALNRLAASLDFCRDNNPANPIPGAAASSADAQTDNDDSDSN